MNDLNNKFEALINKLFGTKKESFDTKYIFKHLKVKNKEMINILSQWINQLIIEDKVDLINIGIDKKNESIYMAKDFFLEQIKQLLLTLDFLLDENSTFSFLNNITETQQPNIELLVKKISQLIRPLVKFDNGSRNVPIMFNLFKIFVPERMINISDQMMEKIETDTDIFSESKQVKKMMFKGGKQQQDYSVYQIIITALSYILIEKGELILTKQELIESRGYKVFFNSPKFSSFAALVKKIYPFSPFAEEEFISFYPENWLDISQIKKQLKTESPEHFLKKNYNFLTKTERQTLIKIFTPDQYPIENDIQESNKQELIHESENTLEDKEFPIQPIKEQTNVEKKKINIEKSTNEKRKENLPKKKKPQKSEPLSFLNEMIYKEKENKHTEKSTRKVNKQSKESDVSVSLIDHLDDFDKTEKHYLLRILDSTKIDSGYYTHSEKDEKFKRFIDKISSSNSFVITEKDDVYSLNRNHSYSIDHYKSLREKLEESIMNSEKDDSNQKLNKAENIKLPKSNEGIKESENTSTMESKENLLDDLLLNDRFESDGIDEQTPTDTKNHSEDKSLIIENKKVPEEEDFKIEDVDHESFFEIPNEHEVEKEDEVSEKFDIESDKEKFESSKDQNQESTHKETTANTKIVHDQLDGKIISVLTDDQEKWLKIKMLSEEIGFELRDGLAYKPEIAVFDEGFSHLEPIAKNTGAVIMHIDEFMTRLGLRDHH